jgi:hypothetical protein
MIFGWKTLTGNMAGGVDRVELTEFGTLSEAKFAAIEAHDRFWREIASIQNKAYVVCALPLLAPSRLLRPLICDIS